MYKFKNPEVGKICYNVDKENGRVVAYFRGGMNYWTLSNAILVDKILDPDTEEDSIAEDVAAYAEGFILSNYGSVPVGIAQLHEDDEWDEEVGRRIARKKLLTKFTKFQRSLLVQWKRFFAGGYAGLMYRFQQQIDILNKREHKYVDETV